MADAGDYAENEVADYLVANGAPTAITSANVKLHTGDPGETGVGNVAGETTRKAASFAAASGGVASMSATISWVSVSTTETIVWVSVWDNISAGNHLWNGILGSSVPLTVGDDFDLTALTLTVA